MRQLNNNHFDTNLGATSHVSSAYQPLSVTKIIKDEIMMNYIKKYKKLKATDWHKSPSGLYLKIIKGKRAEIYKKWWFSKVHNDYRFRYQVIYNEKYIGSRSSFKKAMLLAEGGK